MVGCECSIRVEAVSLGARPTTKAKGHLPGVSPKFFEPLNLELLNFPKLPRFALQISLNIEDL